MRLAARHLVGVLLIASMLLITVGVFTFARPVYHSPNESPTIDFSKVHYYSPATVKRAFARHGIELHSGDVSWWMSDQPPPWRTGALQVLVGSHNGKASWGAKLEPYDERFGNVFVSYGGHDEALLRRVKAAVSDIRKHS